MYFIKYIIAVGAWAFAAAVFAQDPNWAVSPVNYQYSMSVVSFLTVDGNTLTSEQDKVAAFVNGETRGVTSPILVSGANRYLTYLTIYANTENEVVEFKIYNSAGDNVLAVDTTLHFIIDEQYGDVFQAFSIASPALNNKAEIKKFWFSGIDTVSTTISEGQVDIIVDFDQDITDLNAEFIISSRAGIYIDRKLQESGAEEVDFSDVVVYSVLSEDESTLADYEVTVRNLEASGADFFSTNVITANNDGHNDYWIVQDVFKYRNHKFKIFDANGRVLFESIGYDNDWGGDYNGKRLDRGQYYFIIEDMTTKSTIKGTILLL